MHVYIYTYTCVCEQKREMISSYFKLFSKIKAI